MWNQPHTQSMLSEGRTEPFLSLMLYLFFLLISVHNLLFFLFCFSTLSVHFLSHTPWVPHHLFLSPLCMSGSFCWRRHSGYTSRYAPLPRWMVRLVLDVWQIYIDSSRELYDFLKLTPLVSIPPLTLEAYCLLLQVKWSTSLDTNNISDHLNLSEYDLENFEAFYLSV